MPGAACEPRHIHLYDSLVLEIYDGEWLDFAVARCNVCANYIVITEGKYRVATYIEAKLIARLVEERYSDS